MSLISPGLRLVSGLALFALLRLNAADEAGPAAGTARTPYPISGYWMYARPSRELWQQALDRIHSRGADTVIQFGPRLRRVSREMLEDVARYPGCGELLEQFEARLAQAGSAARLRHLFVLGSQENFGPAALLASPGWDTRVKHGDRVIFRLVIPVPGGKTAPAALPGKPLRFDPDATRACDLVFVIASKKDSVALLLEEASHRNLQVYVGLPAPPTHPRYPWDTWNAVLPTYMEVADRIFRDYAGRLDKFSAFTGVYQTQETPAHTHSLVAVLAFYRACHRLVRRRLPGKKILVSPYWDARRKRPTGGDPESVYKGILAIARTDVDIIAPQDGRGTGKVGLFWPEERARPVASNLAAHAGVGRTTYGKAYYASTREFYRAARRAVDHLRDDEGRAVALWANLEAFEAGRGVPCGSFKTTHRTTKKRLDRAVMFAGPYPEKLICYMWDSYFICRGGKPLPLGEEIAADAARPILVDAARETRQGAPGIVILGYHLANGVLEVQPAGVSTGPRREVPLEPTAFEPDFGRRHPRFPERLERAWAPLRAPAGDLDLRVRTAGGQTANAFWLPAPESGTPDAGHEATQISRPRETKTDKNGPE